MTLDRIFIRRVAKITTVISFCLCIVLSITVALLDNRSSFFIIFVVLLVLCLSLACSGVAVLICFGKFFRDFRESSHVRTSEGVPRVELSTSERLYTIFGSRRGRTNNNPTPDLDYEAPPPYDEAIAADEIVAGYSNQTVTPLGPSPDLGEPEAKDQPLRNSCSYEGLCDVAGDAGQSMLATSSDDGGYEVCDNSIQSSSESLQTVIERPSSSTSSQTISNLAIPEANSGEELHVSVSCDNTTVTNEENPVSVEDKEEEQIPPPYPGELEGRRQFRKTNK